MTIEPKVTPKTTTSTASHSTAKKPISRQSPAKRTAAANKAPAKPVVKKTTVTSQVLPKQAPATDAVVVKTVKSSKVKMERDSFTMPVEEYAQLAALKARLLALGHPAKKSELLRAGIKQLVAMTDLRLKKAMAAVPVIKTGRPKKKKS